MISNVGEKYPLRFKSCILLTACEMPPGVPCFHTGMEVIEKYAFKPSHVPYDFVMMAVLYCCFHLLGFVALHVRAKIK